jgi:hypothetical protein
VLERASVKVCCLCVAQGSAARVPLDRLRRVRPRQALTSLCHLAQDHARRRATARHGRLQQRARLPCRGVAAAAHPLGSRKGCGSVSLMPLLWQCSPAFMVWRHLRCVRRLLCGCSVHNRLGRRLRAAAAVPVFAWTAWRAPAAKGAAALAPAPGFAAHSLFLLLPDRGDDVSAAIQDNTSPFGLRHVQLATA